jgi:hypothetical protein
MPVKGDDLSNSSLTLDWKLSVLSHLAQLYDYKQGSHIQETRIRPNACCYTIQWSDRCIERA